MKKLIISLVVPVLFAIVTITPSYAHACGDGCYGGGYSYPSYYESGGNYGYSYGNYGTYYSPSYTYSRGGMNYPYQSPTHYSPSYYVSDRGYNYSYSYAYPSYPGNYPTHNPQPVTGPRPVGPEWGPGSNRGR